MAYVQRNHARAAHPLETEASLPVPESKGLPPWRLARKADRNDLGIDDLHE